MSERFREGDGVALQGAVTLVHDDGHITVRVLGYDFAITLRAEHVNLTARYKAAKRKRPAYDEH